MAVTRKAEVFIEGKDGGEFGALDLPVRLSEPMYPGQICYLNAAGTHGRPPKANYNIAVYSGDVSTGHHVTPTVNGIAMTPVNFNTNQALSAADLATALQGHADIKAASIISGTSNRQILIIAEDDKQAVVSFQVAGATPPTITPTYGTTDKYLGLLLRELAEGNADGILEFKAGKKATVRRDGGSVSTKIGGAAAYKPQLTPFVRLVDGDVSLGEIRGQVCTDNLSGKAVAESHLEFCNAGAAGAVDFVLSKI